MQSVYNSNSTRVNHWQSVTQQQTDRVSEWMSEEFLINTSAQYRLYRAITNTNMKTNDIKTLNFRNKNSKKFRECNMVQNHTMTLPYDTEVTWTHCWPNNNNNNNNNNLICIAPVCAKKTSVALGRLTTSTEHYIYKNINKHISKKVLLQRLHTVTHTLCNSNFKLQKH